MNEPVEVLITISFSEELLQQLQEISPRLNISVVKARKPDEVPDDLWKKVQVLYTHRIIPDPEKVPDLRWIQFHWAGVDHAIDTPLLNKPGLIATTLSGVATSAVAEYILTMMLALGHHIPDLFAHQRRVEWPKDRLERFSPHELRESTVGIVGYGSIGRQVARLLFPFGSKILATKRNAMHPEDQGYATEGWGDLKGEWVHRLYPPQALKSMLKECDFIVVTTPLTPRTLNMIGADEFAVMKPTSYLIQVSRGSIVNQAALINALRDHKIAGAALDVFTEEPLPGDNPLWKFPNVIITPHIAGNTLFYEERAIAFFKENLQRYLTGLPLFNRYDPELKY